MKMMHLTAPACLSAACLLATQPALAAPVTLTATLTGANETAGGDAKASGGFKVTMDAESNDFCYSLWSDKPLKATMAHLHAGAAGADGAPVVSLELTGKVSDECLAIEKDKLEPIAADPAAFYVNVHTADFPKGAMRGQLVKEAFPTRRCECSGVGFFDSVFGRFRIPIPTRHPELVSGSIPQRRPKRCSAPRPHGLLLYGKSWARGLMDPETSSG